MIRLVISWLVIAGLAGPALAQGHDTTARAALVIDLTSGAILLEKDADRPLPPASMSKLMTLYMVFEALEKGVISMTDRFRTSKRASDMKGSTMFLREGGLVSVADLIRGVIVQSGNDAAVALAEALAGTEAAFAARMTKRATALGLTNSTFANATGWPDPEHRMSTRDLAILAGRLITDFPQYYPMFAETEFTWDKVVQKNRNPLLGLGVGADGLKTGHTQEAGYCLVASAVRGKRRVVLVVIGLDSENEREREAERLINWAFRAFETRQLFARGEAIAEAPVWIGSSSTVALTPVRDIIVTAPIGTLDQAQLTIRYHGPVPAPITAGQEIGQVEIRVPELDPVIIPLVAGEAVEAGSFLTRVQAAGTLLIDSVIPD